MALRIEDYALIGDCHTGALVGNDGSIDWLCLPRFDSASTFGALLGDENHGRWLLAPRDPVLETSRAYIEDTFVLVTRWVTATGEVEVTDLMPHGDRRADVVRRVHGISGSVTMAQDLRLRFDYAEALPWMRQVLENNAHALIAVAGPDAVIIRGPKLTASDHTHTTDFTIGAGETVDLTLTWYPAHRPAPDRVDVTTRIRETLEWWRDWAALGTPSPLYHDEVHRSLLVLRALTHEDTGGIVAAATTSLPESFGGNRNWDYRYVWLRDASLTLHVLLDHGFDDEADGWRNWLLRAVAGDPADIQIMYGLSGERRLAEWEVGSLPGYHGAAPVRAGNDAWRQYQGDIFGEVMLALQAARRRGIEESEFSWALQRAIMSYVEDNWRRPDNGIWEIRGAQRHFTHSRAMIWAAFDCAIEAVRDFGLDGPVDRWEKLRDEVREEIEARGFDTVRNSYTQYYGSVGVDASLLQLSQIGYVAADDPRMLGTVAAIEEELLHDGLLMRYRTESGVDGLPAGEHPFLACSFWLVEQYARSGRVQEATALMDRLVGFANDVGLLSEEYDVGDQRQAGNTPQALTHLALVRAADALVAASPQG
ncbi:MAG TPA: glycoside hydrolase family 15 protein [Lacisediminihabitans sp.]|uniref:glycoside hydrolase family 15 protein n=1 Tax=Lacisediminihabitans sp. TaxID=2787631 RepID=UPI002EDB1A99